MKFSSFYEFKKEYLVAAATIISGNTVAVEESDSIKWNYRAFPFNKKTQVL